MVSAFFFLLALAGQASKASTSSLSNPLGITFDAAPSEVISGFTKSLHINCSTISGQGSPLDNVVSIILSKRDGTATSGFTEIVGITSNNKLDIRNITTGGSASGHINAIGSSFLAVEWTPATSEAVGDYKCQVFGMDSFGHPQSQSADLEISERVKDLGWVVQRLTELQDKQTDLTIRLDNAVSENDKLRNCCSTMSSRLDRSRDAMMEVTSDLHRCRKYILSHRATTNQAFFSTLCRLFGGYLAEINDLDEWNFVTNFVKKNNPSNNYVALGATDEGHEGVRNWTWLESNAPVNYTNWGLGQPNGGVGENCMYFLHPHSMFDWVCENGAVTRFICEMPVDDCE